MALKLRKMRIGIADLEAFVCLFDLRCGMIVCYTCGLRGCTFSYIIARCPLVIETLLAIQATSNFSDWHTSSQQRFGSSQLISSSRQLKLSILPSSLRRTNTSFLDSSFLPAHRHQERKQNRTVADARVPSSRSSRLRGTSSQLPPRSVYSVTCAWLY